MANPKADVVIEAVHYTADGQVDWVRGYKRRGPTFSDRIIFDRDSLVDLLKAGKKVYAGERILLRASTFKTSNPIKLVQKDGKDVLVTGDAQANHDTLQGVPLL